MEVFQGTGAAIALGATLWHAWRTVKQFVVDAGHVDDTFAKLIRQVNLLQSTLVCVGAVFNTRSDNNKSENELFKVLEQSRNQCQTTVDSLRETIAAISERANKSKLSQFEFIEQFRKQLDVNNKGPRMDQLMDDIDMHIQVQTMVLVCILR
jgi:hypothetical protein